MDMTLASIVLALLLIVALILHEQKRREAQRLQAELDRLRATHAAELRVTKNRALIDGYQLCQRDIYVAAVKADQRDMPILDAIRNTLPPAQLEQTHGLLA